MKKSKILSMAAIALVTVGITFAVMFYTDSLSFGTLYNGEAEAPSISSNIVGNEQEFDTNDDFVGIMPPESNIAEDTLVDAYKVFVDGEVVGIVSDEESLDEIMNNLLDSYKSFSGVSDAVYEVTQDVQIKKVQTFAHNITSDKIVEEALSDCVIFKVNAFELSKDGYHLGYYATEQECLDILQASKDKFISLNMSDKNVIDVAFDNDFDIDEVYILTEDINDVISEDAVEKILSDRVMEKSFTVTTQAQLDELYVSKTVNLDREVALARLEKDGFVHVVTEERLVNFVVKVAKSTVKKLSYSTTTKLNSSLSYKVKRTSVKGVNGSLTVNYEETYLNGEYVSTEEVSQKRINPINEVIEYGTKVSVGTTVSALTGAGRFVWPTSGIIYGLYGKTSITSNHTGVDIAASSGTTIYASAAGEVVEVGYNANTWGYYVKIKHDSTYSTLYLHMSRYTVTKGQKVKQGDVIGYVGRTGFVTGSHCHFSIIKNGSYIDPVTMLYGYDE